MRKPRDYRAEYQRRIERAEELGYSRSVARGHPKKGELGVHHERETAFRIIKQYHDDTSRRAHEELKDLVYSMSEMHPGSRPGQAPSGMQAIFIRLAQKAGFKEHQAFSLWFSP